MSKKKIPTRKRKQKVRQLGTAVCICAPFVLLFATLFVYGFTNTFFPWLTGITAVSWFILTGVYTYTLIKNPKKIITGDAFYYGKRLSWKETLFFAYVYDVLIFAIGVFAAVIFFRELI